MSKINIYIYIEKTIRNRESMTATAETLPTLPDTAQKGIALSTLIEYKKKDLSDQDIADLVGCSRPNVTQRLEPYKHLIDGLDNSRKNKSDSLEIMQEMLLGSITPEKIKGATLQQTATSYGILFDKQRLQDGKSTDNISMGNYDALTKELQELNAQIIEAEKVT